MKKCECCNKKDKTVTHRFFKFAGMVAGTGCPLRVAMTEARINMCRKCYQNGWEPEVYLEGKSTYLIKHWLKPA